MDAYTNTELVHRLQKDDETGFAYIYKKYHNAVYANICKLVNNSADAEDILQEVFVLLWNNRMKLSENTTIDGWLFSSSYFKSLEFLRKALRKNIVVYEDVATAFIAETVADEDYEIIFEKKLSVLNDGIELLSPQKKSAFTLCRVHGKSYEEAAVQMGISTETVKSYVKESVNFLKRYAVNQPMLFSAFAVCCLDIFLHA